MLVFPLYTHSGLSGRWIFDIGQGHDVYADCPAHHIVFSVASLLSVLFQTKDLGLWYLWVRHQQTDVYVEQWTLTTRWSMSQSLCMLQRLCCTNSWIPFSFKCLSFVTTGCLPFSVALLQFEVYLWLILAIKCFALPWLFWCDNNDEIAGNVSGHKKWLITLRSPLGSFVTILWNFRK